MRGKRGTGFWHADFLMGKRGCLLSFFQESGFSADAYFVDSEQSSMEMLRTVNRNGEKGV